MNAFWHSSYSPGYKYLTGVIYIHGRFGSPEKAVIVCPKCKKPCFMKLLGDKKTQKIWKLIVDFYNNEYTFEPSIVCPGCKKHFEIIKSNMVHC